MVFRLDDFLPQFNLSVISAASDLLPALLVVHKPLPKCLIGDGTCFTGELTRGDLNLTLPNKSVTDRR